MKRIRRKPQGIGYVGSILFITVGIVIWFMGYMEVRDETREGKSTNGTVIEIMEQGSNYVSVEVRYMKDEVALTGEVALSNKNIEVGDTTTIYYDDKSENYIADYDFMKKEDNRGLKDRLTTFIGWFLVGLLFAGAGMGNFYKDIQPVLKRKLYKDRLQLVYAKITEVKVSKYTKVYNDYGEYGEYSEREYSRIIYCEYGNPMEGKAHIFKSEYLWYDPTDIIKKLELTQLPVYVDMRRPKRYYVCIDQIDEAYEKDDYY